jgi:hypothetical protein
MFLAALALMLPLERCGSVFVRPETIRRWHRALIARQWTYPHRRPGRPAAGADVRALIVRLARENPGWGYRRVAENGSQPFSPARLSCRPTLRLRRAVSSVSLTTSPVALDRNGLAG